MLPIFITSTHFHFKFHFRIRLTTKFQLCKCRSQLQQHLFIKTRSLYLPTWLSLTHIYITFMGIKSPLKGDLPEMAFFWPQLITDNEDPLCILCFKLFLISYDCDQHFLRAPANWELLYLMRDTDPAPEMLCLKNPR